MAILSLRYCAGFIALPTTFKLDIPVPLPECLLQEENKSNHASTMFNDPNYDVAEWFRSNLVRPLDWELQHPDDIPHGATNDFDFTTYQASFLRLGYKLWDIQYRQHATSYLQLISTVDSKTTLIAGRADFLVTLPNASLADYLNKILCVIEVQSKEDEDSCELQMLVYLLILMNTKHLERLVGFLVFNNGQCQAFKATRGVDNNCIYEMNDRFHIAYISDIFHEIVLSFGN
jgi:hypothetical protein